MAKCLVKKGFFVLRDCGNKASQTCSSCERTFCRECSSPERPQLCVECWARQQQAHLSHKEWDEAEAQQWHDSAWVYAYRNRFYHDDKYKPFYAGKYLDDYYDDYDLRSFLDEDDMLEVGGMYDLGDGDFFDS